MTYSIRFLPEAIDDLRRLDGSQRIQVEKAIKKVATNPLPESAGGYGKPLGNTTRARLAGLQKIKLKALGIRIVYKLIQTSTTMLIVVIGARSDGEVYDIASRRWKGCE